MSLSGGAQCIKYTLFIFNLLFVFAGLTLIIVGAIVQAQASKNDFGGGPVSAGGVFIIVLGSIIFLVSFFGCAGAINENHCMVVTYGVFMILLFLALIAGIATGFYMRDRIEPAIAKLMDKEIPAYNPNKPFDPISQAWNETQSLLKCCGSRGYWSWNASQIMMQNQSVPDSCCENLSFGCGYGKLKPEASLNNIYQKGCVTATAILLEYYLIIVGAVAAGVAALELVGIIFAFCLAHSLRKGYRVV